MGFDHAEQKEVSNPSSTAGSTEPKPDDISFEKPDASRRDTVETIRTALVDDDDDEIETAEKKDLALKHTHTHTLGKLTLRAVDDDDPSDWWFASTAIPLIAATFAPMANCLSIAALVVYWRDTVKDTGQTAPDTAVGIKDPHWCTALNITSLVCGFVGNLFLLFNFTKRVRYIVALPTTIVLFYIAAGILIGITSCMAIYTPPKDGEIYSQGFWHAVIAACLYTLCSMILMINMVGYFLGHYPQHFTLTHEQRNLILQTMMFFLWLSGGAGIFAATQGWSYVDALYFCDVTVLTVGFGDFYATNNIGRGLVFPFSVGGIIILGLMVSSIHKFAGELSKDKVIRAHMETNRVQTLSRAVTESEEDQRRDDLEKQLARDADLKRRISSPLTEADLKDRKIQFGGERQKEPSPNQFVNSKTHKSALHRTFQVLTSPVQTLTRVTSKQPKVLVMKEERDRFNAMRDIQENATTFKKWYALMLSVLAFALLWCVGALVFWQCEKDIQGMTYFQGLYFCYVSLLTIGYGDLSPKSNAGKPFFIVWSLIAVPTMTILISDMGDTVISAFKNGTIKLADFTVLPKDGIFKEIVDANPWLRRMILKRGERKRVENGFEVGPDPDDLPVLTIEELAEEKLSDAELTKKLAFAIRKTAEDMKHHTDVRYSYEEWVEFTRLIRFTKMGIRELKYDEEVEGVIEWDWLAENSPMLSEQSEAEWVLDRLCESLLRLLKKRGLAGDGDPTDPQPQLDRGFSFAIARDGGGRRDSAELVGPIDESKALNEQPVDAKQQEINRQQEKRQRATGADAILTFFTGERRGTHAYAKTDAIWSARALEKMNERRRSSVGFEAKKGPFKAVGTRTGAVGGGRGGAGNRALKQRFSSVGHSSML